MRAVTGGQQSDSWVRARVGRATGSRLADACSYLTRASNGKKAGDSSAKRDAYKFELIGERLSGRSEDHFVTQAMQDGMDREESARLCYEGALRVMCQPVGFVLHPEFDFTGSSPDSLVGDEGVLEIKCPTKTVHLGYIDAGMVPEQYIPQIAWELACTGRRFADFVSYNPEMTDSKARFFYRRLGRDELTWIIDDFSSGKPVERILTGEAVIDYFTSEVIKLDAEIRSWIDTHGFTAIAPFSVDVIEAEPAPEESGAALSGEDYMQSLSDAVGVGEMMP